MATVSDIQAAYYFTPGAVHSHTHTVVREGAPLLLHTSSLRSHFSIREISFLLLSWRLVSSWGQSSARQHVQGLEAPTDLSPGQLASWHRDRTFLVQLTDSSKARPGTFCRFEDLLRA